ncbi:MAG: hypothetical protein ACPGGG_08410 [Parvibaculales bacterium]
MNKIDIPWWLTAIIIIEILPMFLGPLFALTNPRFIGGPDATSIGFAAHLYAARNIAVGLAFIAAFILKNGSMLFILIFIRLLTDLMDLPNFLIFGQVANEARAIFIFTALYYLPAIIALRFLWPQIRPARQP